ncbi:MAG: MMPL family transporter [Treponema sp.]|nr:MMPL family transporter [Treponema sp.]
MRKLFKYPWLIVGLIALITVFFALQLGRAQLDNNNFRFVPADDPALLTSRYIDETFGSSLFILVGLERKYGTVFDGPFLKRMGEYVDLIGDIPVVGTVTSLINTEYITSRDGAVVVEKLLDENFSGTSAEIAELKRRIFSWDMYERALVSDDFTATQILVPLNISMEKAGSPEITREFEKIRDTAQEMFAGLANVHVAGMPVISATVNEATGADLILLVPLVVIVVLGVLFFSFRRFTAVALPLITVVVATVWSMGAMPLFGVKLSIISTVLPVILVAVGSAYGIHVVTHYVSERGHGLMTAEAHRELVFSLVRKIGRPVFLAALTTFVGFFSCCFTTVLPIREFGIFSSFGVIASFAVALTLIPALLLIRGPKPLSGQSRSNAAQNLPPAESRLSNVTVHIFTALVERKMLVLFIVAMVAALSIYGMTKVIIDNVMVEYFKEDTAVYRSDVFIREQFGGSKLVNVVMEAETPEILLHPDSLAAMDGLGTYLTANVPETGKVMGFTSLIKRINQVFNADESPEGIPPLAPSTGALEGAVFEEFPEDTVSEAGDFSWDFGFDEWGSDDSFASSDSFTIDEYDYYGIDDAEAPVMTAAELMDLLDRAASEGSFLNGSELVRELKRLTNYEGAAYYEIPSDPAKYGRESPEELQRLISNYMVLLSGNISDYANDPIAPTAIKTTVQLRTVGEYDSDRALKEIDEYIAANFPGNVKTTVGGAALVEFSLNALVVQSQLISLVISIVMVFIIVALSNRSLAAGLIGIVPLTISILINFGVMGFLGIKLNLGTAMVASVSIGIGIDYTIHYLEAFLQEYRASGGKGDYLRRTFATSGKAIIINALSVGAGFAVLRFSQFNMLADLGLLIALTMGTSALLSLTVIPVLLTVCKPKFIARGV